MNMYWIYVLWSHKLHKRYVGSTSHSPQSRLLDHNHGKTPFTSKGIPWILLHSESYPSLSEARKRELFLKSGVGRKWLDQNINIPLPKITIEGSES
jgi:putative endonuclease